jgi:hypothetical protein
VFVPVPVELIISRLHKLSLLSYLRLSQRLYIRPLWSGLVVSRQQIRRSGGVRRMWRAPPPGWARNGHVASALRGGSELFRAVHRVASPPVFRRIFRPRPISVRACACGRCVLGSSAYQFIQGAGVPTQAQAVAAVRGWPDCSGAVAGFVSRSPRRTAAAGLSHVCPALQAARKWIRPGWLRRLRARRSSQSAIGSTTPTAREKSSRRGSLHPPLPSACWQL